MLRAAQAKTNGAGKKFWLLPSDIRNPLWNAPHLKQMACLRILTIRNSGWNNSFLMAEEPERY